MENSKLVKLMAEIRALREQTLLDCLDLTEDDFDTSTDSARWDDVRRVLLRFGDHMREHANQIEDARVKTDQAPTMPQRMLVESELAWGKLLGAVIGLSDEQADLKPSDGGWSVIETLEHIKEIEIYYQDLIQSTRSDE